VYDVHMEFEFTAPLGVTVKGEVWSCVEIPDARERFGSLRSVRVDATVDGITLANVGLMPTGTDGLMFSVNAKTRERLAKDVGDVVQVTVRSAG
jgi:hypothetical protein